MLLAEVPGAARVNLRPAEHLLFCNGFQKCILQLLGFQAPQAQMGGVKPAPKPSWTGGVVCAKFHQDPCWGLDFH